MTIVLHNESDQIQYVNDFLNDMYYNKLIIIGNANKISIVNEGLRQNNINANIYLWEHKEMPIQIRTVDIFDSCSSFQQTEKFFILRPFHDLLTHALKIEWDPNCEIVEFAF